jgi:uncharacterized protein YdaU (DUF1376 family)
VKLKRYPYFRMFVGDFVSDARVEAMSTEQVGCYVLLLCKAWTQPDVGTVPDDDRILARWARISLARWKRLKDGVMAPWRLIGGVWHQKRMQLEYARLVGQSDAQSLRALGRWSHAGTMPDECRNDAGTMPNASPPESESESESDIPPLLSTGDPPTRRRGKFVPPSLEEVAAYAVEVGARNADPKEFHKYWTDENWIKPDGDRVKDWKRTFRNRERAEATRPVGRPVLARDINPDVRVGSGNGRDYLTFETDEERSLCRERLQEGWTTEQITEEIKNRRASGIRVGSRI